MFAEFRVAHVSQYLSAGYFSNETSLSGIFEAVAKHDHKLRV